MKHETAVSKKALDKAVEELEEIQARRVIDTHREKEIRTKMAELFHNGEDGTQNIEIHGYKIKVVRRMDISISKDAEAQLAADNPKLYAKCYPKKVVHVAVNSEIKAHLEELEDYVTTKQGLPTITIDRIK